MNGISFYICISDYKGFRILLRKHKIRIVFGFLSVTLILRDIEKDIGFLVQICGRIKNENL